MSVSEKKMEANKMNAQNAGVKTEEGKLIVRENAFKHGLRADTLLVNSKAFKESQADYDDLLEGLLDSFKPTNSFEEFCVHGIAKAIFKLRRADKLEATLLKDEDSYFSKSLDLKIFNSNHFDLVLRYRVALSNEISKHMSAIHHHRHNFQLDLFGNSDANK